MMLYSQRITVFYPIPRLILFNLSTKDVSWTSIADRDRVKWINQVGQTRQIIQVAQVKHTDQEAKPTSRTGHTIQIGQVSPRGRLLD